MSGKVVRGLASHPCVPGSDSRLLLGLWLGLSLLLVFSLFREIFLLIFASPIKKKQNFSIPIYPESQRHSFVTPRFLLFPLVSCVNKSDLKANYLFIWLVRAALYKQHHTGVVCISLKGRVVWNLQTLSSTLFFLCDDELGLHSLGMMSYPIGRLKTMKKTN